MSAAALVDALVQDRVLVIGTLPPLGRDLDLLVRPGEQRRLRAGLARQGFLCRGNRWARFADCSVEVVELIPASHWLLPAPELDALFGAAAPVPGRRHLVQPAPHHRLLVLARQVSAGDGALNAKRRARVQQALSLDPQAWARASARAPAWRAVVALDALERCYDSSIPMAPRVRARAIAERRLAPGPGVGRLRRLGAGLAAWPSVLPRPRRGSLVALSGLDGSGKSTQAAALADSLTRLGYDAVVQWTSLAGHPWLEPVGQRVSAMVAGARALRPARAPAPSEDAPVGSGVNDPQRRIGRRLRERSRLLDLAWTLFVAGASGQWHWRVASGHLLRGRVVICDRYVLDSKVQMRFAYGEARRFTVHTALMRALSPRPRRAYFLDASPAAVSARNDDFAPADVERRARLYREEHRRLGVRRVDADRPLPEVCAEIGADVWMGLG